ncbi:MAG: PIN domain-containing protein [Clostridiales bacterium]|nr:PIN domain-containing protein [Clostridiales bacterium]
MVRVYLDSCCYNRPFDDLSQERIYHESEAVLNVISKGIRGEYEIVGSDVVEYELYQIRDIVKRQNVLDLYKNVQLRVEETDKIENRAREIRSRSNIHTYDSLQIACAEECCADVMLTTDDKLERMAAKAPIKVRVINPAQFVNEMLYGR